MAGEISTPHDNLFRSVFGDTTEASALLRAYLPQAISRQLLWSTLAWQPVGFIDDRLRDSESDLLYLIQRKADAAPAWLYVLLEHQSTPDAWLRFAAAEVQHPHLGTGIAAGTPTRSNCAPSCRWCGIRAAAAGATAASSRSCLPSRSGSGPECRVTRTS